MHLYLIFFCVLESFNDSIIFQDISISSQTLQIIEIVPSLTINAFYKNLLK